MFREEKATFWKMLNKIGVAALHKNSLAFTGTNESGLKTFNLGYTLILIHMVSFKSDQWFSRL